MNKEVRLVVTNEVSSVGLSGHPPHLTTGSVLVGVVHEEVVVGLVLRGRYIVTNSA